MSTWGVPTLSFSEVVCTGWPGLGVETSARAERAMRILGELAPEHLAQAGMLRIEHPRAGASW